MKITAIHIDGFGQLRDKTLQLDQPLTVLYGRNEAGKSTLMGFIRAVLFGFPPHGSDRFEPLHGAAQGGYLTLVSEQGEVLRVERREGAASSRARSPGGGSVRVTLADGTQGGAELLQPLLGGITGELFRSLFAFSLSELQEVRTLQSDALSGYLYSAGLGARGGTIVAAERKLAQEMEQLFRPRGKNQAINQTLQKLEEQEVDIRRSKEQAGRYNDRVADLAALDGQIAANDLRLREQRNELAWREAAEQARNHWLRKNEIHHALAMLPEFTAFPEDALLRFTNMDKDKEQYRVEIDKLQQVIHRLQTELNQITADPTVLQHQLELNQLVEHLGAYRSDQFTESELRVELEQQQLQIDKLLRQIAAHWSESTLAQYAVTVSHREQVRQFHEQRDKLEREKERVSIEIERLSLQVNEAKGQQAKLEINLKLQNDHLNRVPSEAARRELEALPTALPQLRKQLQQLQKLKLELQHVQQREQDYILQSGDSLMHTQPSLFKQLWWLLLALSIAIPALFYRYDLQIPAIISFIALLGVTFFAFTRKNKASKNSPKRSRRSEEYNHPTTMLQSEKAGIEQQIAPLERSFQERVQQWVGFAQAASTSDRFNDVRGAVSNSFRVNHTGISDEQAEEWIEQLQQAAEAWRIELRELQITEQRAREAADAYELLFQHKELEFTKLHSLETKLTQLTEEWRAWLKQQQLSAELAPTAVFEIFQLVEQGQQLLGLKHKNEAKRQNLLYKKADFERQARSLLGDSDTSDLTLSLKRWKEAAEKALVELEQKQRLEQQLQQTDTELLLAAEAYERNEQRMIALWGEAKAEDEPQFRLHVRQHNERLECNEELQQIESALDVFIGLTRKIELDGLLRDKTPQELRQEIVEHTDRLSGIEQHLDQMKELRGKQRNELEKLELGAEHSERLQQWQEQTAILHEQAGQWATRSFCSALFKKARELYERERQPGVLLAASDYFQQITNGEYTRVLVPFGEKRIVAQNANGQTIDSSLLSRGTAEQLYLSMRFALADEYARKASLPLIMDDILVNFDRDRLNNTIAVLGKVAQKHQIMLFTCHSHVIEAFAAILPQHQRINL
ncbi:MAG: hypothetical protein JWM44_2943 [Bacilli bacterium]|nr:hypothetical protein [Bacilli bacterium]